MGISLSKHETLGTMTSHIKVCNRVNIADETRFFYQVFTNPNCVLNGKAC